MLRGDAANLDALRAAAFAGEDSNSREGDVQMLRKNSPTRLVGAVIYRRRGQAHTERSFPLAFDGVAARPRLHPHGENHRPRFFCYIHLSAPASIDEYGDRVNAFVDDCPSPL